MTNQIIKQAQEKIQTEIEHLSDRYVEFWEREFSGLLKEKIDGGTLGAGAKSYMIRNSIWKFMVDNWDKILDQAITQAVEEEEKEEIKFLKRMNLEFEVVACDCGEPYKDTDPHNYIKERLDKLTK